MRHFLSAALLALLVLSSAAARSLVAPGRQLLQEAQTLLRVLSFDGLPTNTAPSSLCSGPEQLDCPVVNPLPEVDLSPGTQVFVNVTGDESPLFGTHSYSPENVRELFRTLAENQVRGARLLACAATLQCW